MRRIKCRWKKLVSRGELEIFQKKGGGGLDKEEVCNPQQNYG